jgi:hypothetical protein
MKTRSFLLITLLFVFAFGAFAADISGKWVAQVEGRNGTREVTFTFKADGGKLTGSQTAFQGGEWPLEGKIDGDNVSFTVKAEFNGNTREMNYTGTVSGNEMKLKREGGRGPQEFTAKKQ